MDVWYYATNGRQQGPVTREDLQRLLAQGTVSGGDYVWTDGMAEWQTAGQVPELVVPPSVSPPAAPAPGAPAWTGGGEVPNYLVWAIVVTVCCCMPGGIASIVFAVHANALRNAGNVRDAQIAANKARTWIIVSIVVGLVTNLVWLFASFLPAVSTAIEKFGAGGV